MTAKFVLDVAGNEALLTAIAAGLHEFAGEVSTSVRQHAPRGARGTPRPLPTDGGGVYVFYGRPGKLDRARYRRTISHSTYLAGSLFAGSPVRGIDRTTRTVRSVVYTSSFAGHLLEFGTAPHEIPVSLMNSRGPLAHRTVNALHPGSGRFPHFWPGLAAALPNIGPAMASRGFAVGKLGGKLNVKAL